MGYGQKLGSIKSGLLGQRLRIKKCVARVRSFDVCSPQIRMHTSFQHTTKMAQTSATCRIFIKSDRENTVRKVHKSEKSFQKYD